MDQGLHPALSTRDRVVEDLRHSLESEGLGALVLDRSPRRPVLFLTTMRRSAHRVEQSVDKLADWLWRRVDGNPVPWPARRTVWTLPDGCQLEVSAVSPGSTRPHERSIAAVLGEVPVPARGLVDAPGWAQGLVLVAQAGPRLLRENSELIDEVRALVGRETALLMSVAQRYRLGPRVGAGLAEVLGSSSSAVPGRRRDRAASALVRHVPAGLRDAVALPVRCRFAGLDLLAGAGTFLPRRESEGLARTALEQVSPRPSPRVIDLGTGCGAIALTIASGAPSAHVLATDLEREPLRWVRRNANRLGLSRRVDVAVSNLFDQLPAPWRAGVDLVVGNIPHVPAADFERAADTGAEGYVGGDQDGLGLYRRLLSEAPPVLARDGAICLQLRSDQVDPLLGFAAAHSWHATSVERGDVASVLTLIRAGRSSTPGPA